MGCQNTNDTRLINDLQRLRNETDMMFKAAMISLTFIGLARAMRLANEYVPYPCNECLNNSLQNKTGPVPPLGNQMHFLVNGTWRLCNQHADQVPKYSSECERNTCVCVNKDAPAAKPHVGYNDRKEFLAAKGLSVNLGSAPLVDVTNALIKRTLWEMSKAELNAMLTPHKLDKLVKDAGLQYPPNMWQFEAKKAWVLEQIIS